MSELTEYFASPEGREIQASIVASISRTAIRKGLVDPAGKSLRQVQGEAARIFLQQSRSSNIGMIVDHTQSVLDQARDFQESARWDHAIVFYAIFIEHWCNQFLLDAVDDEESVRVVLRRKSPMEKLRLSWQTLKETAFPAELSDVAQALFDRRNEFVHYKFSAEVDDDIPDIEAARRRELRFFEQVEHLIGNLHALENDYFFGGRASEFGDRSGRVTTSRP